MNDLESTLRSRLHDLAGAAPDGDGGHVAGAARTRHRRHRNRMAVLAVCAGLVVVAGGSTAAGALLSSGPDGSVVTAPGETTDAAPTPGPAPTSRPVPSPTAPSSLPSSTVPSSTPPSPSAPSGRAPGTAPAPAGTPAAGAPVTSPRSTPTAPAGDAPAAWPTEATAVQGGVYWAVFLDVSRAGDTAGEQEARAALSAAGYRGSGGDVGCAQGAAEALGLDPAISYTGVWVEFTTAADAQRFVDRFQPGVVGTARVTAYCLD